MGSSSCFAWRFNTPGSRLTFLQASARLLEDPLDAKSDQKWLAPRSQWCSEIQVPRLDEIEEAHVKGEEKFLIFSNENFTSSIVRKSWE